MLNLQGNRAADLTPEALNGMIASCRYERGDSPPVGLFDRLWPLREAYLTELLDFVRQDSLRQLAGRIEQIQSDPKVSRALGLVWWLFADTTGAVMRLTFERRYEGRRRAYGALWDDYVVRADRLLRGFGLTEEQCSAMWEIRLSHDSLKGYDLLKKLFGER